MKAGRRGNICTVELQSFPSLQGTEIRIKYENMLCFVLSYTVL